MALIQYKILVISDHILFRGGWVTRGNINEPDRARSLLLTLNDFRLILEMIGTRDDQYYSGETRVRVREFVDANNEVFTLIATATPSDLSGDLFPRLQEFAKRWYDFAYQ